MPWKDSTAVANQRSSDRSFRLRARQNFRSFMLPVVRVMLLIALAGCGRLGFDDITGQSGPDAGPVAARCPALLPDQGSTQVSDTAGLISAVAAASPGDTITLADGVYRLTEQLVLDRPDVTLRSVSGDPSSVTLDAGGTVDPAVRVAASGVRLEAMTIARSSGDGVAVEPTATGDLLDLRIYDVTFLDHGGPGVRARPHRSQFAGPFADDGTIACSRFLVTPEGTERSCNPNGFGIRASGARGWILRDNYFAAVLCDTVRARALWVTNGSRDITVVDNEFTNIGMNIMLGGGAEHRTYPDALPAGCTGTPEHRGGVVCNNRIAGLGVPAFTGVSDFEEGIALWGACDTWVTHNTIVSPGNERTYSEVEYRFPTAYVHLVNNLLQIEPRERDGGQLSPASQNTLYPAPTIFVDAASGDLRLAAGEDLPQGASIRAPELAACATDAAGQPRDLDAPTPGAYER
jgi:hypothetical protein